MALMCLNCGTLTDGVIIKVPVDSENREPRLCCTSCGSDDLADAEECAYCGEFMLEDEIQSGLCPDCYRELMHDVKEFLDNYTDDMWNILLDLMEEAVY